MFFAKFSFSPITLSDESPMKRRELVKNPDNGLPFRLVKRGCCQIVFCQESLTKLLFLLDNKRDITSKIMGLKENGGRMAVLGGALAAGLAGAPDQAEAQDFTATCNSLGAGETLSMPITPETLPGVYDAQKQLSRDALQSFSQELGDGLSESCGLGDIGVYVTKVGERIQLAIYPPGKNPLGIDGETYNEIQAHYAACVTEAIDFADENENGIIEPGLEARYLEEDRAFCNETASKEMSHAQKLASLDQRIAASQARQDAMFASWTREILNGN